MKVVIYDRPEKYKKIVCFKEDREEIDDYLYHLLSRYGIFSNKEKEYSINGRQYVEIKIKYREKYIVYE